METTLAIENIAQQNLDVSIICTLTAQLRLYVLNSNVSTPFSTIFLVLNTRRTTPLVLLDEMHALRTLARLFLPE